MFRVTTFIYSLLTQNCLCGYLSIPLCCNVHNPVTTYYICHLQMYSMGSSKMYSQYTHHAPLICRLLSVCLCVLLFLLITACVLYIIMIIMTTRIRSLYAQKIDLSTHKIYHFIRFFIRFWISISSCFSYALTLIVLLYIST